MGMIPQDTIDQIRDASDIVDVIGSYLKLKKRGRNFLALCPFHTEKTPSFNVNPERQIYHCFGCGVGGNVITFLMEHEKMSFVEAVKYLAERANITIREDQQSDYRREQYDRLAYANQVALDYFKNTLHTAKYRSIREKYLKQRRGLTEATIEEFELGLAGEEWEGLLNFAQRKDVRVDDLQEAGLILYSDKSQKHFDRFRTRLMIPIHNMSGKPIAFGGRTLKKGEPAKYINSPETPLYQKSQVLYNLHRAKEAARTANDVYVVEGYFDVITLHQVGIQNVVASSGTAFTAYQARLLARFAETVYLFFDADSAGRQAALRSVDALYDAGLEVKVMLPPEGEDPDSLAKAHGAEKIRELTEEALSYIAFRLRDVDTGAAGIIGREKLVKELASVASKISDPTRRTLFLNEAADSLNVTVDLMLSNVTPSATETRLPHSKQPNSSAEREFVSLLLCMPGAVDSVIETVAPKDLASPDLQRAYAAMIHQYEDSGTVDPRRLIDTAADDSKFVSLISSLAAEEWPPEEVDAQLRDLVKFLMGQKRKRIRQTLKEQLAQAEAAGNHEKARQIQEEIESYL